MAFARYTFPISYQAPWATWTRWVKHAIAYSGELTTRLFSDEELSKSRLVYIVNVQLKKGLMGTAWGGQPNFRLVQGIN